MSCSNVKCVVNTNTKLSFNARHPVQSTVCLDDGKEITMLFTANSAFSLSQVLASMCAQVDSERCKKVANLREIIAAHENAIVDCKKELDELTQ